MRIELVNMANTTTIMAEAVIVVAVIVAGAYVVGKYFESLGRL